VALRASRHCNNGERAAAASRTQRAGKPMLIDTTHGALRHGAAPQASRAACAIARKSS
jgi:hypothetical protein